MGRKGIYDFVITEVGGTVGDIESLPYVEAIRQLKWEKGKDALSIHLTLLPYLSTTGELKTKPTQHSVKELLSLGVQPDVLVCRTEHPMVKGMKEKIALFCNVEPRAVIESADADTIYDVPLLMQKEHLDVVVLEKLGIVGYPEADLTQWTGFLRRYKEPKGEVNIGLVGKYVELKDAYKSIKEALDHAGAESEVKVNIRWVHSEKLTPKNIAKQLGGLSGILVAPGFGHRGIEGKIEAIKYARENKVPFLGICLGMQCAVIEFARNVLGMELANSTEMDANSPYPGDRDDGGAEEDREQGRHHAIGRLPLQADRRQQGEGCLRQEPHQRAPPAPLRIQQRLHRPVPQCGHAARGHEPTDQSGGGRGTAGPPVVHRRAVPPRVQEHRGPVRTRSSSAS